MRPEAAARRPSLNHVHVKHLADRHGPRFESCHQHRRWLWARAYWDLSLIHI